MTDSLDAIRAEIAELRDAIAGAAARREQIAPEIEEHDRAVNALRDEAHRLHVDATLALDRVMALERAEAVLIEHSAPAPVAPDPAPEEQLPLAPAPAPCTPARQRIRDELHAVTRPRYEEREAEPVGEAAPEPTAAPRSPRPTSQLTSETLIAVHPKPHRGVPGASTGTSKQSVVDGGYADLDVTRLSRRDAVRADLVHEILSGGPASSMEIQEAAADELASDHPGTVQTAVSRALAILYKQGRAEPTGDKAPRSDGKLGSPIWRLTGEDS